VTHRLEGKSLEGSRQPRRSLELQSVPESTSGVWWLTAFCIFGRLESAGSPTCAVGFLHTCPEL
jgi:hypothetical protein